MFGIMSAFVSIILGAIELLLSLRFIFRFFSVNPEAPFVAWLYGFTAPLVAPFARILPDWKIFNFVIDSTTLIALIVYVVVGYFLLQILSYPADRVTGSRI